MHPEITRAAQTLADHALVLLATGIALIGVALVAIVAAVHVARRYQASLVRVWTWLFAQMRRVPVLGPSLQGARVVVPPKYVILHLVLGLIATAAVMAFVIV